MSSTQAQKRGRCYVHKGMSRVGANGLIKANKGRLVSNEEIVEAVRGKPVRFGAYGEPVLLGESLVKSMAEASSTWTGYTHQWRNPKFQWARRYFMASVHSAAEAKVAHSMGWRTYRVSDPDGDDGLMANEIICPGGTAGGHRVQCNTCKLCQGAASGAKSIVEWEH